MRFLSTHKRGRKRLSRCRVAAFEVAAFEKVPTGLLKAIAAAFGILSLPGCIEQVDDAPDFSKSQCRRAPLIDVATGAPIIGAEDIALDPDSSRLIISAYDRRAVEQAARHLPSEELDAPLSLFRLRQRLALLGRPTQLD